ncbi:MAG: hypothetical protein FWC95_06505 [Defluviitaleaceae bacterium]|nr:hypothetical protein [Defluviitaleaceae bacterium]
MQNIFNDIGSVTGFITLTISVFGIISIFLSNISRHLLTRKYGIPLKATLTSNIAESANVWISLMGSLGLGIVLPIALLNVDIGVWPLRLIVGFSAYLAFAFTKRSAKFNFSVKKSNLQIDVTIWIAVIVAISYQTLHEYAAQFIADNGYGTINAIATHRLVRAGIGLGAYFITLAFLFINGMKAMLYGAKGGLMIVMVDGQMYLVTMRSAAYHWILLPCEYKEYKRERKLIRLVFQTSKKFIVFTKGEFIVRDLTELNKINHASEGIAIDSIKYDLLCKKNLTKTN